MARVKEREGVEIALVLFHAWPKTKIPFLVLSTETLVTQAIYVPSRCLHFCEKRED